MAKEKNDQASPIYQGPRGGGMVGSPGRSNERSPEPEPNSVPCPGYKKFVYDVYTRVLAKSYTVVPRRFALITGLSTSLR